MPIRTTLSTFLSAAALTACTLVGAQERDTVTRGQTIYAKECAQCHGTAGLGGGPASLGLGAPPPDLVGLKNRNDGHFPREFVRRFVLGMLEKDDPDAAMPDFATTGFRHVYPKVGADGEVLESDFNDLLSYLEAIQQ